MSNYAHVVLYSGVKTFREIPQLHELLIINHPTKQCLEVIVAEAYNVPIARLYLNSEFVVAKIDLQMFNANFQIKTKSAKRLRQPVDGTQLISDISSNMIVAVILKSLSISKNNENADENHGISLLHLNLKNNVEGSNVCEYSSIPLGLIPYDLSNRLKIVTRLV